MMSNLEIHLHANRLAPADVPSNGRSANHLLKRLPPRRDTAPAAPTAQQKKARRRARKQARRR